MLNNSPRSSLFVRRMTCCLRSRLFGRRLQCGLHAGCSHQFASLRLANCKTQLPSILVHPCAGRQLSKFGACGHAVGDATKRLAKVLHRLVYLWDSVATFDLHLQVPEHMDQRIHTTNTVISKTADELAEEWTSPDEPSIAVSSPTGSLGDEVPAERVVPTTQQLDLAEASRAVKVFVYDFETAGFVPPLAMAAATSPACNCTPNDAPMTKSYDPCNNVRCAMAGCSRQHSQSALLFAVQCRPCSLHAALVRHASSLT
jgi:hypothetical protein